MKQIIRDRMGRPIGTIDVQPSGDKILRDPAGRILGRYDKRSDLTKDPHGRTVAKGDALTMLLNR